MVLIPEEVQELEQLKVKVGNSTITDEERKRLNDLEKKEKEQLSPEEQQRRQAEQSSKDMDAARARQEAKASPKDEPLKSHQTAGKK